MQSNPGNGTFIHRKMIEADSLSLLVKVALYCKKHKIAGYLVGGFIRDTLLGHNTSDIDIAIAQDVFAIGDNFAADLKGKFVPLDIENKFGRIVFSGNALHLDISTFAGTIEADLARRDFTIDTMAVNLSDINGESDELSIIDPFHGGDDLDHNLIRVASETSLASDPLRLLRAVRLAAELGFKIEHKTEAQIKQSADLLLNVAGERIREELLCLLDVSRGGQALKYMDELGLLMLIIPEMAHTKDVAQPAEHHWAVFEHSIMTVSAVDYILGQGVWDYADDRILTEVPWSPELAQYFEMTVTGSSTRRTMLKLAALLHDVAKPQTKTIEPNGKMRFLGHNEEGAAITAVILERLRFSIKEINLVTNLVKYHLRPNQMGQPPSRRAVYRYFRDVGDAGLDVLFISLADHLATRGPGLILPNWRLHTEIIRHIMDEYHRQEKVIKPTRFLDGNDLINIFGLKPGPKMGALLEKLREAQATGELIDRQAALNYIKNLLTT